MTRPLVLLMTALLCGCAVGPRYSAPKATAPDAWLEDAPAGSPPARWWETFHDAELNRLMTLAEAGSLDLAQAKARLAEARAATDAARGAALPAGAATASYSHNRLTQNGEIPISHIPGFRPDFSLFDGGFDASWEVDLWGRQRRAVQAARARAESAEADRRDTLLRLRAEVARRYFTLRADQAILESARADVEAQARTAELARRRFQGGEANRFDLDRSEAQARATAATVPGLEADTRDDAFAITQLLGRRPEELADELLRPAPLPQAPETIAVGLRSDMLRRRPDIAKAERDLAAATADTGAAVAALFPSLSLTGAIGQQSQSIGDLTLASSNRFQAGPSLSWPILQMGTLRAQVRAARARGDSAAARYQAAVLAALEDSESALNRFSRAIGTEREAQAALTAAREAETLARQRYAAGEDDLTPVLAAQSAADEAARSLSQARLGRDVSAVSLFKALGV